MNSKSRDFASWLEKYLHTRGITKRDFAAMADISEGLVYSFTSFSHTRDISTSFCVKVAAALRIPTNDVLKRAGFPTVGDSAPGLTPHEAAMLRDYRRLSPKMRVRAAKIIEDLL